MIALLDYLSVFEDDNFVRIEDGFKAVGNDEAGPASDDRFHGFLDFGLGHRIDI